MITIRNTGLTNNQVMLEIPKTEQQTHPHQGTSVSTRPLSSSVLNRSDHLANDAIPAQLRDVVPLPRRSLAADELLQLSHKLAEGVSGTSSIANSKQRIDISDKLSSFLTLRHKAESGQGGAHLINWMRDFDIPVAGEREMNSALLCASTKTALQSQHIEKFFGTFADEMCMRLEAKGIDPFKAAAITVVSTQVHQTTLLAAAVSGATRQETSPIEKDIAGLVNKAISNAQKILAENTITL